MVHSFAFLECARGAKVGFHPFRYSDFPGDELGQEGVAQGGKCAGFVNAGDDSVN